MKADPLSIGKILSERQRFVVPIYQRTYEWRQPQLEPLWEQVLSKANERLSSGRVAFSHYMGALLLIPDGELVFARIQPFNVVDGQQRLTTFHLCFAALRDLARDYGFDDIAAQLADLIIHSDSVPMTDRASERYKLQPSPYDRSLFHDIIDLAKTAIQSKYPDGFFANGKIKGNAREPLAAYWFFWNEAETFVTDGAKAADGPAYDMDVVRARLLALSTVLFEDFRLIVITLGPDDDAQVIFETLNSGGKPLAAMDLVRNDVFHRAKRRGEDQAALMTEHWSVFEQEFWKQEQSQGRLKKPRIDFFLAHVLSAERGGAALLGELYADYKRFVAARNFPTIADELKTLTLHAPTYRALVAPPPAGPMARLSRRLNTFDVSTAYALVFVIAASDATDQVKERLYDLIASYIIRRALCYVTSKNYNIVFADVAAHLKSNGVNEANFSHAFAIKIASEAAFFPDDDFFRAALLVRKQYEWVPRHRLRLILQELEFASRDKFNVDGTLQDGLQIEHVMPRTWQTNWPLPSGRTAPADLKGEMEPGMRSEVQARLDLIDTLGNLTLLTPPANAAASNYGFEAKKERLNGSLLKLNTAICGEPVWDEAAIIARGRRLAEVAVRIWPFPVAEVEAVAPAA